MGQSVRVSARATSAAELLDLEGSLEQRTLAGGTASETVRGALERARAELEEEAKLLERELLGETGQ